jgi:hypothetical protein
MIDRGNNGRSRGETGIVVEGEASKEFESHISGDSVHRSNRPVDEALAAVPHTDQSFFSEVNPIAMRVLSWTSPERVVSTIFHHCLL